MNATIPSELAAFVRETGIRAFDRVAATSKSLDKSLQSVLKSWARLSAEKKNELFDVLLASAREEHQTVAKVKTLPEKSTKRKKQT